MGGALGNRTTGACFLTPVPLPNDDGPSSVGDEWDPGRYFIGAPEFGWGHIFVEAKLLSPLDFLLLLILVLLGVVYFVPQELSLLVVAEEV